jgi:hypothetical protein
MGDVWGPENVNNTYMKTVHAGMMARGFTIIKIKFIKEKLCFRENKNATYADWKFKIPDCY